MITERGRMLTEGVGVIVESTPPPPCARSERNHASAEVAREFLAGSRAELEWIFPPGKRERVGVLVELGQIALLRGEEACRTMARAVCAEPHPATTREAAAMLRRSRLGLPEPAPAATSDDFQEALEIALAETVERNPEIPLEALQATVQNFAAELGELVGIVREVLAETH